MKSYNSEQKSLTKAQILMYKTRAYRLVNGGNAHKKADIRKEVTLLTTQQYIDI